jgi:hypothetical protein
VVPEFLLEHRVLDHEDDPVLDEQASLAGTAG